MESKKELMKRLKEEETKMKLKEILDKVEQKILDYDPEEYEEILENSKFCEYFEEMIDEMYSTVHILDLEFFASDILKKVLSKNEYHYVVQSFVSEFESYQLEENFESYRQLLKEKEMIMEMLENENDN